jgi:hypothetical protein
MALLLSAEEWNAVLRWRAAYSAWNQRVTGRLVTCPATHIEELVIRHRARLGLNEHS